MWKWAPVRLLVAVLVAVVVASPSIAGARPQSAMVSAGAHAAIVGGTAAVAGTDPWLAFVADNLGNGEFALCSGTVVAPNVILTAAHCVLDPATGAPAPASNFAIVTGDVDWTDAAGRQISAVSAVLVYPGFDPLTLSGDAALLVLASPTTAPAIPLATSADAALIGGGGAISIAGWGDTIGGVQSEQTVLQTGTQLTQAPGYCSLSDGADSLAFDPGSEFCAIGASLTTSTCHGDSGGPALAATSPTSVVQVGITSRGDPVCNPAVANIFTRVDLVQPWVAAEIAAVAPQTPAASVAPSAPASPVPTVVAPAAGRYTGSSSQRYGEVHVTLGAAGVTRLNLLFTMHCTRGRLLRGPFTETARWPRHPLPLTAAADGSHFSVRYLDPQGNRYAVAGTLVGPGSASGTLTVTSRNHACTTGPVRWSATLQS